MKLVRIKVNERTIKEPDNSITLATSPPKQTFERKQIHTAWTLNNWTPEELAKVEMYAKTKARYMCWSQEIAPTTGTPHLQGYTAWTNEHSLGKFIKDLSPRIHLGDEDGNTNGSAEANRAYCLGMCEKKGFTANPTFIEVGNMPQQGKRTDWATAVEQLQTREVAQVVIEQPQLLPCIRALERFKQLSAKPTNRDVKCIVLIGESGVGKSRYCYDNFPNLYSKPEGQWYDGYTDQDTILLDDYYGDIPYSQFLKVLDRYPLTVPIKGGFVHAKWTTVLITSNRHPRFWYSQGYTPALERRMNLHVMKDITDAPQVCTQDDPQAASHSTSQTCSASSDDQCP